MHGHHPARLPDDRHQRQRAHRQATSRAGRLTPHRSRGQRPSSASSPISPRWSPARSAVSPRDRPVVSSFCRQHRPIPRPILTSRSSDLSLLGVPTRPRRRNFRMRGAGLQDSRPDDQSDLRADVGRTGGSFPDKPDCSTAYRMYSSMSRVSYHGRLCGLGGLARRGVVELAESPLTLGGWVELETVVPPRADRGHHDAGRRLSPITVCCQRTVRAGRLARVE